MVSPKNKLKTVFEEDGWQVVDDNWWTITYSSVSWSYAQEHTAYAIASPPFYHESLFSDKSTGPAVRASSRTRVDLTPDITLNHLLCGVQCVEAVVAPYENAVGFFLQDQQTPIFGSRSRRDISLEVAEDDLARSRSQWQQFDENLLASASANENLTPELFIGGVSSRGSSPSSSAGDLSLSISTPSSIDFLDSNLSFTSISVPSTPKGKDHEIIVEIKDSSLLKDSSDRYSLAGRPLNASASSFIPSFAKNLPPLPLPSSDSFATSLQWPPAPPAPKVRLKKDDQGYYSKDDTAFPNLEAEVIPSFLQKSSSRRRATASRTREIIDRLRSSHQARRVADDNTGFIVRGHTPDLNPPLLDSADFEECIPAYEDERIRSRKATPALDEDDDGWIDLSDQSRHEYNVRETFLAFTRRRSASASPNIANGQSGTTGSQEDIGPVQEIDFPRTFSPVPLTPPVTSFFNDGWVIGPPAISGPDVLAVPRPGMDSSRSRQRKRHPSQLAGTALLSSLNSPLHSPPMLTSSPFSSGPNSIQFPAKSPVPLIYGSYSAMVAPMAYASCMQQLQFAHMKMQMNANANDCNRRVTTPNPGRFPFPKMSNSLVLPSVGVSIPSANRLRRESLW